MHSKKHLCCELRVPTSCEELVAMLYLQFFVEAAGACLPGAAGSLPWRRRIDRPAEEGGPRRWSSRTERRDPRWGPGPERRDPRWRTGPGAGDQDRSRHQSQQPQLRLHRVGSVGVL